MTRPRIIRPISEASEAELRAIIDQVDAAVRGDDRPFDWTAALGYAAAAFAVAVFAGRFLAAEFGL